MDLWLKAGASYAGEIDGLFWLVTALVGFWFFVVQVVFFYLLFRFRRKAGVPAQHLAGRNWGQLKWVFIPLFLIIGCDFWIDVATARVWENIKEDLPAADETVRVIGQQWAWTFVHAGPDGQLDTADDIRTIDELHLELGKTYHYELTSKDVLHSFSIPNFRLKQDAVPGRTILGWFKPTLAGAADIQCVEICGVAHAFMAARMYVETPTEHAAWLARAKAAAP
jgi:cytochrome c oxidase subunit 2